MQHWSIIVPRFDNAGQSTAYAMLKLEHELMTLYGGFTSQNVEGSWLDNASGKIYHDQNREYSILCEDEPALASLAADLFPDQLAFAIFHRGAGDIWNRPQPLHIVASMRAAE